LCRLSRNAEDDVSPFSYLVGSWVNSGADAHVDGRSPARPFSHAKRLNPQKKRDERFPHRPSGLPYLTGPLYLDVGTLRFRAARVSKRISSSVLPEFDK
jgi:hypothetical protein